MLKEDLIADSFSLAFIFQLQDVTLMLLILAALMAICSFILAGLQGKYAFYSVIPVSLTFGTCIYGFPLFIDLACFEGVSYQNFYYVIFFLRFLEIIIEWKVSMTKPLVRSGAKGELKNI